MTFVAEGIWVCDKVYGNEFKASRIDEKLPDTNEGLIQYLSSGFIKGIGPVMAKKIVGRFGSKTFDVFDNDPDQLLNIKGINKKKLKEITKQISSYKNLREALVFLKSYGISDSLAGKIYNAYQNETMNVVKSDPYRLVEEIEGVGFRKADEIALKMGFDQFGEKRIGMGLKYVLIEGVNDRDTFIPFDELVNRAASPDILDLDASLVTDVLRQMIDSNELKNDDSRVYLSYMYKTESSVAMMIAQKGLNDMFDSPLSMSEIETDGVKYSDEQLNAIELALKSKMTVITGGPGVGKTTILKGLLSIFSKHQYNVLLAAPTGRAAKRMSEATRKDAVTIHRLLKWKEGAFTVDEKNPLTGDVLILDECSMINLQLMNSLLKAIPLRMKLIMVGDVDQLPSIGCGKVLKDIIDSGMIPVAKLTKIYRQDKESKIILNAHAINDGRLPDLSNPPGTDFYFFRVRYPEDIREQVIRLVTNAIPKKFGIPLTDIQVLSPMRKPSDIIGSTQLNNALQDIINPQSYSIKNGFFRLKVGDRVMQNKNNYDLGVYNGDIGIIRAMSVEDRTVTVEFFGNDQYVEYERKNLDELELAYATTVHKSQGSEYPAVVIVASKSQYIMLQKQLFYTAVTRAKKICIVVGSEDAIKVMISTKHKDLRHSWLCQRIIDATEILKDKHDMLEMEI